MKISIVTTLYNSASFVRGFHDRVSAVAAAISPDYEIIYVNDGSPDHSFEIARDLAFKDARTSVIDLSRNFGHHKAMMTGLRYARGERVFLIDSDLEEPPELLTSFNNKMTEEGCDVVFGYQEERRGTALERWSGETFYWLVGQLCDISMPRNQSTVRLMTQRYVRSLLRHREHELIIAGLWIETGYRQVGLPFTKDRHRRSNYSLRRRVKLAVDFVTANSNRLLYLVFYGGLALSIVSLLFVAWLLVRAMFFGAGLAGWTSIMLSVWTFGSLNILCLGLLGIYVARIFKETKNRPYTIVREVIRGASSSRHELAAHVMGASVSRQREGVDG